MIIHNLNYIRANKINVFDKENKKLDVEMRIDIFYNLL